MPDLNGIILIGESDNEGYLQANTDYCVYHYTHNLEPTSEYNNFWTHIELGAGNYGLDGHTKTSQTMTVLMELKFISELPNYVDKLPEYDAICYSPSHQYAVLFHTLDQLVAKKGEQGIFHVNDLFPEYAEYAADQLKQYANAKGYNKVIIEAVSGDYTKIMSRQTLIKYSKFLYDDAHLKNPEVSFYNYGMNGDEMLASVESRKNARIKLQTLADLSYNGLYFFSIYTNAFIPKEEKLEFISKNIFYHRTDEYSAVPYHFPEGPVFDKKYSDVYHINPSYSCS